MFVTFTFRWSKSGALAASIMLAALGCWRPHDIGATTQDEEEGIDPPGESSAETASADGCSSHIDCGIHQICQSGECVPNWAGGPCDVDLNCIDGEICDIDSCAPVPATSDMACGGEVYQATPIAPNVLIVLDRSGSMDADLGGQGTKWEIARAAIGTVVDEYNDDVRFGLALYPGLDPACDEGMGCAPGDIFVDIDLGTATDITDVLDHAKTCSLGTPTAEMLDPLQSYHGLEDPDRLNYILLITDGQSTCANPVPMVAALHTQSPSIETFVVGFGADVDPFELNQMAQAGGTALMGYPKYYQADDAQALVNAFGDIAGSVIACAYVLDMVPPDPSELYVYINDKKVPRDPMHVDGWDYEPKTNQVTMYGQACDLLQSGQAKDLQIVFGCPETG